jgi:hypothetical protein
LASNQWVCKYIFKNTDSKNEMYYVSGNAYNTRAEAFAEVVPSLPSTLLGHAVFVGKIIIQKSQALGVAYGRNYTGYITNGSVTSHNDFSDIQGVGSGVTAGHISDVAQTIYGDKTFAGSTTSNDINLTALTGTNIITDTSVKTTLQNVDNIYTVTKQSTGFTNNDTINIAYDSTARTITLTGTFEAYFRGKKVAVLTNGWVSSSHATGLAKYYLYYNGSAFVWATTAPTDDALRIADVYYNTAEKFAVRRTFGFMQPETRKDLHKNIGSYVASGGTLSGYTSSSNVDTNRRPSIALTEIVDEDLTTLSPAHTSQLYTKMYLTGSGTSNFTLETAEIVPLNGNQPYYNQLVTGTWQQTLLPANNYMSVWLVALPVTSDTNSQKYRYIWVQGQSISSGLSTIQGKTPADVNLGTLPSMTSEYIFLAKVIIQYVSGNWIIVQVDALRGNRFSQTMIYGSPTVTSVNSITPTAGNVVLTQDNIGDGSTYKQYSEAEKTKLSGIATGANNYVHPTGDGNSHIPATGTTNNGKVLKAGATENSVSWSNVDWSEIANKPTTFTPTAHNHAISEVTNLQTSLDAKVNTSDVVTSPTANKILKLDANAKLPANITGNADGNSATATKLQTARTINGVNFDGSANITINAVDSTARIASSEKGAINGVATLDSTGKVPSSQLPSYVDDVLEYTNYAGFPATGETGKIYVDLTTNKCYRWSGSAYVYITSGAVDSVNGKTGVVTLSKSDVGLGNVTNNAQVKKVSSSTDNAIVRWDGVTGDLPQDSLVTISDTGTVNIPSGQNYNINGVNLKDVSETLTNKTLTAPVLNTEITGTGITTTGEANKLLKVNSSGATVLGGTSSMTSGMTGSTPKLITANLSESSVFLNKTYTMAYHIASVVSVGKSKSTIIGTESTTLAGDALGYYVFEGVGSGNTPAIGASIEAIQSGTAGASFVPADIIFKTCTSTAHNEVLRLKSDKTVNITSLAGTGSRMVVADASGILSASVGIITNITKDMGTNTATWTDLTSGALADGIYDFYVDFWYSGNFHFKEKFTVCITKNPVEMFSYDKMSNGRVASITTGTGTDFGKINLELSTVAQMATIRYIKWA